MRLNLELITAYLQKQPTVSAAYLFGSHAKGTARADSDVDIAVLFTTGLSFKERFDLKLSLAGDLEELLTKQVDVVDLEEASYLLRHQVFLHGILLFEKIQENVLNLWLNQEENTLILESLLNKETMHC